MQEQSTKRHTGASSSAAHDFETRSCALLRDEYEKQLNTLKKQHELSVKRLNNEVKQKEPMLSYGFSFFKQKLGTVNPRKINN
jgi:hypothetical protein